MDPRAARMTAIGFAKDARKGLSASAQAKTSHYTRNGPSYIEIRRIKTDDFK